MAVLFMIGFPVQHYPSPKNEEVSARLLKKCPRVIVRFSFSSNEQQS
jgi:hypothetical protein